MGYYLLVNGSVISGFGLWAMLKSVKLLVMGVRTRGVIVGVDEQLRRGDSQRKKIYFHPVIEFETAAGNLSQFTFGSGCTRKRPAIGDAVTVVYEFNKPEKATLNWLAARVLWRVGRSQSSDSLCKMNGALPARVGLTPRSR